MACSSPNRVSFAVRWPIWHIRHIHTRASAARSRAYPMGFLEFHSLLFQCRQNDWRSNPGAAALERRGLQTGHSGKPPRPMPPANLRYLTCPCKLSILAFQAQGARDFVNLVALAVVESMPHDNHVPVMSAAASTSLPSSD